MCGRRKGVGRDFGVERGGEGGKGGGAKDWRGEKEEGMLCRRGKGGKGEGRGLGGERGRGEGGDV